MAFDGEETAVPAIEFAKGSMLADHPVLQGGEDIEEAGLPDAFEASGTLPISYLIAPDGHIAWSRKGSVDAALLGRLLAQTKAE